MSTLSLNAIDIQINEHDPLRVGLSLFTDFFVQSVWQLKDNTFDTAI